jgi:hypothetical protein
MAFFYIHTIHAQQQMLSFLETSGPRKRCGNPKSSQVEYFLVGQEYPGHWVRIEFSNCIEGSITYYKTGGAVMFVY